ncbi:MAG: TatD family hydrolase [Phycisphaerales bacterium]
MIDTHCHLTFPDFEGRVPAVLSRAAEAGVTGAITISTTTADCLRALALAKTHANVWCSSGVHPLHAHEGPHDWGAIRLVAADPGGRCVAWGELGLDNHYTDPPRETQMAVLSEQLAMIEQMSDVGCRMSDGKAAAPTASNTSDIRHPTSDMPIILHCRDAFTDLIPILRRTRIDPRRFVFHCFTGTPRDARLALDFGAMVSFTGIVTYRNAADIQEAARLIPLDRIMVETDAPYLSPDPHRGQRPCEPWMASLTARKLAELRGEDWDTFHAAINDNARRFFGVA